MKLRHRLLFFCTLLVASAGAQAHGDVAEHIDVLSKEYDQQPSEELLIRRARAYLDQHNGRAARKDLNRALELAPQRHEIWYWLAKAQLLLQQPQAALTAIDSFLVAAPDAVARASGLVVKGDALLAAGKASAAGEAYVAALALESDANPEHVLKAMDAFHAASDARWLTVLDDGLRRLGPLVSLLERGYAIDMERGRYDSALARVEQMLTSGRRRPQLLHKKALTLQALRRFDEARATLESALAELDRLPEVRRQIPALVQLRQDIEQALHTTEQAAAAGSAQ